MKVLRGGMWVDLAADNKKKAEIKKQRDEGIEILRQEREKVMEAGNVKFAKVMELLGKQLGVKLL